MPAAPETARVFFALWPDEAVRGALAQLATGLRRECGGRAVPARNIHLTLAFLGNIDGSRLPQLSQLAAMIDAQMFRLHIDIVEYWPRNRIVWAGPRQCPKALLELVAALQGALRDAGFSLDSRSYVPHVTLLRNARRAPVVPDAGSIVWAPSDFALVRSVRREARSAYEVLGHWPLKGTA